jgi:hypothetical protein
VDDGRFEIWFTSPEELSIFIEIAATGEAREVAEVALFAAFAARQVANLPRDPGTRSLCMALAELPHPETAEEIPEQVGETRIVPPSPAQGRKGFVGSFKTRNGLPLINLKPKGFGLMGRGVGFYSPTATIALLFYLLRRQSDEGRFVLVETARIIGKFGLMGRIGVRSQADAAGSAVALAIEALRDREPSMKRSDDPEEDYQLLVNATEKLLFEIEDDAAIPQWAAWRICREMTALHYDVVDETAFRMRETARDDESPGPYDNYLAGLLKTHGLDDVADRLMDDCFGQWS